MDCPICAESMSLQSSVVRSCCQHSVCQSCLYRHIQSVFQEGITANGRSTLLCPLGCGSSLSDADIRASLARGPCFCLEEFLWTEMGTKLVLPFLQFTVGSNDPRTFFGNIPLFLLLLWMTLSSDELSLGTISASLLFVLWRRRHLHNNKIPIAGGNPEDTCPYYKWWMYWGHSTRESRDLRRYEQWSLAVALRTQDEVYLHCPVPDCDFVWLCADPQHRQEKQRHEVKPYWLWYTPPRPLRDNRINWVHAEFYNLSGDTVPSLEERDGRRLYCPKCHSYFCGLCHRPWFQGHYKHVGIACQRYQRQIGDNADFVMQQVRAKACPGCTLRTVRSDGCNHMTCPCGTHWCYVCECRWSVRHYACVEAEPTSSSSSECVIL